MNESSSSCTNSTVVDETSDNNSKENTGVDSSPDNSNRTHDDPPPRSNSNRKKRRRRRRRLVIDIVQVLPSSPARWWQRGDNCKLRRPKVAMAQSQRINVDIENAAFLLGTSLAAFVAQVLEKQDVSDEKMFVDHLSVICTSAIRESLVDVFGVKLDCFLKNFESSFVSTPRTPRSTTEASAKTGVHSCSKCEEEKNMVDLTLDKKEPSKTDTHVDDQLSLMEDGKESVSDSNTQMLSLGKSRNDVVSIVPWSVGFHGNEIAVATFERFVVENTRSNDLKEKEIDLKTKSLELKETQVKLNCESNNLKAEELKNQLENKRHSELLQTCIDCLVAGLLIMCAALSYGAYVYSYHKIFEATAICTSSTQGSKSWWMPNPMASLNSRLHMLRCQVQVVSRMAFGVIMILVIAYLLLRRSATSTCAMPVTFIVLLLGVACGLVGKLCIDTLGGNGLHWLMVWETLCLVHLFSNVFTPALCLILNGPVDVSHGKNRRTILPYWFRRVVFYTILLVFMPLLCGLIPFASISEWKDHFYLLVTEMIVTNGY